MSIYTSLYSISCTKFRHCYGFPIFKFNYCSSWETTSTWCSCSCSCSRLHAKKMCCICAVKSESSIQLNQTHIIKPFKLFCRHVSLYYCFIKKYDAHTFTIGWWQVFAVLNGFSGLAHVPRALKTKCSHITYMPYEEWIWKNIKNGYIYKHVYVFIDFM